MTDAGDLWSALVGRHASDEDATLTPIFHALARGGWRTRQEEAPAATRAAAVEPDAVGSFHRDPLAAPLPAVGPGPDVEPVVPPTTECRQRSGAHALPEAQRGGRHHRRFVPLDGGAAD